MRFSLHLRKRKKGLLATGRQRHTLITRDFVAKGGPASRRRPAETARKSLEGEELIQQQRKIVLEEKNGTERNLGR